MVALQTLLQDPPWDAAHLPRTDNNTLPMVSWHPELEGNQSHKPIHTAANTVAPAHQAHPQKTGSPYSPNQNTSMTVRDTSSSS